MNRLLISLLVLLWAVTLRSDIALSLAAAVVGFLGVWLPGRRWLWLVPTLLVLIAGAVAVFTAAGTLFAQILAYVFVLVISLAISELVKDRAL